MSNEVFVLHYKGEILTADVLRKTFKKYGEASSYLYGWRPPKKVYHKIGHARSALRQLPEKLKPDTVIVRYVPFTEE